MKIAISKWPVLGMLLAGAAFPAQAEVKSQSEKEQVRALLATLMDDNAAFAQSRGDAYFKGLAEGQKPRATVVTCSDSRVHMHAFDKSPDGDLFMVRNIGNQISTSEGSVEYGVHHLHTPYLIIIGHSACGAIKGALGNFSKESKPIKRELHSIKIKKGSEVIDAVKQNVNNQVKFAMKKFHHEMDEKKLTVIGAVYDFSNDLGKGFGRLVVTNVNGSPDASALPALAKQGSGSSGGGGEFIPGGRTGPMPYTYP